MKPCARTEERQREEDRERKRAEIEAKEREEREREERARIKAEEEERKQRDAEARTKKTEDAKAADSAEPPAQRATSKPTPGPRKPDRDRDDNRDNKGKAARDDGRKAGKLTLNQALAGGEGGRQRSMAAMKRKQERARQKALGGHETREKVVRDVKVPETIVVQELANRMAERVADVVKALMNNGMMVTQNQVIDADTAELIIEEFGHKIVRVSDSDVEQVIDRLMMTPRI